MIDKLCAIGSICFAVAGLLGLILLSIYDTLHFPHIHDGLLIMFMYVPPTPPPFPIIVMRRTSRWAVLICSVGYLVSAILICCEYVRLGRYYRSQHIIIFVSFCIKASFVVIEIVLAIAFGACSHAQGKSNVSAVLEWGMSALHNVY